MSLNSFSFIICFVIILAVMGMLQAVRRIRPAVQWVQLVFLLGVSYYFLFRSDWRFCVCMAAVTLLTFFVGKWIEQSRNKRIPAGIGIVSLILFLGYFKYANFFVNSIRSIIHLDGITLKILLPIGISFYVFSAISYLIDVCRGDYPSEKNLLNVALFIAFFPKLTAGPIVRGKAFFPQIKNYRGMEWDSFKNGIQIFVFGLFKKIVLADHLGVFVDDVFRVPAAFNTGTVILAVISYSLQIYFDFSGYSDMAIGISKILGFDFMPNFNLPYMSKNLSEFWKRWHISLSSWFQDYLYIPLGGSRKGTMRTYVNLMAVMLVSGLWHGAGWTFIAWGALHGIFSCLSRALGKKLNTLGAVLNGIITYFVVTLLWVVFRADSLSAAVSVWTGMFTAHSGISQPYAWSFFAIGCLMVGSIMALVNGKKIGNKDKWGNAVVNGYYPILDLTKFWSLVVFFTFCGLTIIMGYFGNTAFIYGAF